MQVLTPLSRGRSLGHGAPEGCHTELLTMLKWES